MGKLEEKIDFMKAKMAAAEGDSTDHAVKL